MDRRCKNCGEPLTRNTREAERDWGKRQFCNRQCYVIWGNTRTLWDVFRDKTEHVDSGCIEWTGRLDRKGYGRTTAPTGEVLTHRIAYAMHHGTVPDGLHVLHRCDNPKCVNPRHLFLGTNDDNMADKVRKGRTVSLWGRDNPNYRHGRNCREIEAKPCRPA